MVTITVNVENISAKDISAVFLSPIIVGKIGSIYKKEYYYDSDDDFSLDKQNIRITQNKDYILHFKTMTSDSDYVLSLGSGAICFDVNNSIDINWNGLDTLFSLT
jgi:hypothetical protein